MVFHVRTKFDFFFVIAEPSCYICSTCKEKHDTAWKLIEHVQNFHGVNIYLESAFTNSKTSNSSNMSASSSSSSCTNLLSNEKLVNQQSPFLLQHEREQNNQGVNTVGTRHHPLLPPPDLRQNPFGLLRMPLPTLSQNSHNNIFNRSHHDFRMDQFVSDQFRHHSMNLAAAVANSMNSHQPSGKQNIAPNAQTNISESQLDFYSQRLRQLAGATSTSPATSICSSMSPRSKKNHSPRFSSPPLSQLPPTPLTSSTRPQSLTPPEKLIKTSNEAQIPNTPRSASTPPSKREQVLDELFCCDYCNKKFRFQSNLMVHKRIHTGDESFNCTSCDFTCQEAIQLKKHMLLHRTPEDKDENNSPDETEDEEFNNDSEPTQMDIEDSHETTNDIEDDEEEAEDLSVSNIQQNISHNVDNVSSATSLVGQLMNKFGLSNIAQYSEAYKQALQLTSKDHDNNNSSMSVPSFSDKINGLPAALRMKEEIAKNFLQQNRPQSQQIPNLFNPFENPFDPSKRLKFENPDSWWHLPSLHHRNEALFESFKNKVPLLPGSQGNSLLQSSLMKKEQRRNDTCEFCGKVFKNCSNLTVHRRSHTGEKPYKCELCSYACAQSSKLTRHMKTHGRVGKDVYRCRFCDMPFSVPSTLEKHMRKCVVNQGKSQNVSLQPNIPPGLLLPPPSMSNLSHSTGLSQACNETDQNQMVKQETT